MLPPTLAAPSNLPEGRQQKTSSEVSAWSKLESTKYFYVVCHTVFLDVCGIYVLDFEIFDVTMH